ncbi:MAG: PaaI family thioesterase [Bacteroidota bacterium]
MKEEKVSHFRRLEELYYSAPINEVVAHKIAVGEGWARVTWQVEEKMFHGGGALHGSMYFKMLDDAAFFAGQSLVQDRFIVTAGFNVILLRPVTGGMLRAKGEVVSQGRNLLAATAVLTDQEGNEIARGSGNFAVTNKKLEDLLANKLRV